MCVRKSFYHIIFMGKSKMEPQGCPFQRGKNDLQIRYWKGELQVELHGLYPSCRIYQGSLGEVLNSKEGPKKHPSCCQLVAVQVVAPTKHKIEIFTAILLNLLWHGSTEQQGLPLTSSWLKLWSLKISQSSSRTQNVLSQAVPPHLDVILRGSSRATSIFIHKT